MQERQSQKRGVQSRAARAELEQEIRSAIEKQRFAPRLTFARKRRARKPKPRRLIAYDLETTRIDIGTPRPLYLTAHGADFSIATPVSTWAALTAILRTQFLTPENEGAAFVAWNGNRFDAYLIAAALIRETDLVLRPYLTKSKALRGLQIKRREDIDNKNGPCWEFLDGIAMTGLVGLKLAQFVANFAPDFPKLVDAVDFEKEEFNPDNPTHRAYAYRDSEGLYHAMTMAQSIMIETFDQPLTVTMGGACIKIFQAHIPQDVKIEPLTPDLSDIVSRFVMRGGFCYLAKRYDGLVWKYDLNQAYAAAMREASLPCGGALYCKGPPPVGVSIYVARVQAFKSGNRIPFYYRHMDASGRIRSLFSADEIMDTWLTSIEIHQLAREGWQLDIAESWAWPGEGFSMREYVDKLERLRTTCEGGPAGPIGTMVKATGNHSYGKTVETIEPIEFLLCAECPPDCLPYYGDGSDPIEHIYYRIDDDRKPKAYHQPHLGAWITAHVRMVVRRAALVAPDAWLYADTDCVIFSRDVTAELDIDPRRYGAWKVEESGAHYQLIAKKVYRQVGGEKPKRSAKGLHVKRLTDDDFARWYEGAPPVQDQIQIQNFLAVMHGAEMYRLQTREGTRVESAR